MKTLMICAIAASMVFMTIGDVPAQERLLLIAQVSDAIGPGIAEYLEDALQRAAEQEAAALVIRLDTPGGLVESMRRIVQAIYACPIPVVVYVSPSGARAASAGVMITMAADVAAMAPGTHIGAAHPVGAGGQEIGETMAEKVTNDMVAFIKGIANRKGRNAEWAERAVRESVSITASEALQLNVVDVVADSLEDLISRIDGRQIEGKGKLQLEGAKQVPIEQGLRTKILKTISDPNVVYILMMIGLAGLYFELSNPGAIFPGVIGAMALILALFSFQTLPVNATGILLIALSVVFFLLELKVTSFGLLSLAGIVSMVLGSMMLFKGAGPQFQIAWQVILPTVVVISAFFIVIGSLVVRAHVHQPRTGAEGLIGEIGVVKQVDQHKGKIQIHGELWQAEFSDAVQIGDRVKVLAVRDLILSVASADRPSSGSQAT